ncbi:MAG: hypothetical protein ABI939_04405 [Anaerolineaceae bacterium]
MNWADAPLATGAGPRLIEVPILAAQEKPVTKVELSDAIELVSPPTIL